jgi:hypothetical protein
MGDVNMATLQELLGDVETLIQEKHQAGRHDQSSHTPKKYGKGVGGPVATTEGGIVTKITAPGTSRFSEITSATGGGYEWTKGSGVGMVPGSGPTTLTSHWSETRQSAESLATAWVTGRDVSETNLSAQAVAASTGNLGSATRRLAEDFGGEVLNSEPHVATFRTNSVDRGEVGARLQHDYGFYPKAKPGYAKADEDWYQSGKRVARVGSWTAAQRRGSAARQPIKVWVTMFDED